MQVVRIKVTGGGHAYRVVGTEELGVAEGAYARVGEGEEAASCLDQVAW